ncbi:helix-turn-helix domain-containing protein [Nocardioides litoris]|uniref:helix-turn-helix domain-containing protein n=1 Tax=Nocardioides litoris TaxID=1926648 RepID=UPI00111EB5BC|nr:helix-turn-helix domain-containing protein [Nocardioides litoris]
MTEQGSGRDRLRELLDAVLADPSGPEHGGPDLDAMAGRAFASPFHFSRQLRRGTGESPVAMRRRVVLERAAHQLGRGSSVTDAALAAGYESVEGFARAFARAFGHPPSQVPAAAAGTGRTDHWLPAPNGIHFHPPSSLWVDAGAAERPVDVVTDLMVAHDLADSRALLEQVAGLDDQALRHVHLPGTAVTPWDGEEGSVAAVLDHLVWSREVWLAAVDGADTPDRSADDPAALLARHDAVAPRWRALWRDVDRRGAWDDVLVDALCDPPESFVLGSVLAHCLTFGAHRRQLARLLLRLGGHHGPALDPTADPIMWLRAADPGAPA